MAHPPERGVYALGTQPMVHKGFLMAWQRAEKAVLDAVAVVLETSCTPMENFKVLITGKKAAAHFDVTIQCDCTSYTQ